MSPVYAFQSTRVTNRLNLLSSQCKNRKIPGKAGHENGPAVNTITFPSPGMLNNPGDYSSGIEILHTFGWLPPGPTDEATFFSSVWLEWVGVLPMVGFNFICLSISGEPKECGISLTSFQVKNSSFMAAIPFQYGTSTFASLLLITEDFNLLRNDQGGKIGNCTFVQLLVEEYTGNRILLMDWIFLSYLVTKRIRFP